MIEKIKKENRKSLRWEFNTTVKTIENPNNGLYKTTFELELRDRLNEHCSLRKSFDFLHYRNEYNTFYNIFIDDVMRLYGEDNLFVMEDELGRYIPYKE